MEKGKTLPNAERLKEISNFGNISVNQLLYGDFLMLLENMAKEKKLMKFCKIIF